MSTVANSSPLIVLAKLGYFDLLRALHQHVYISAEVYREVVISGAGLPGSVEVEKAEWVEVRRLEDPEEALAVQAKHALGIGEISAILLAKQLRADTVLLDDQKARAFAKAEGLRVQGSVGLLEMFYHRGHLADLRGAFRKLLASSYLDRLLLENRLRILGLGPL